LNFVNVPFESWLTFFIVFLSTCKKMQISATTKITIPSSHITTRRSGADRAPALYYGGTGFKSETFCFPQFLHPNAYKIFRIRPQTLPSTLFSIHYSLIIVSLEVTLI